MKRSEKLFYVVVLILAAIGMTCSVRAAPAGGHKDKHVNVTTTADDAGMSCNAVAQLTEMLALSRDAGYSPKDSAQLVAAVFNVAEDEPAYDTILKLSVMIAATKARAHELRIAVLNACPSGEQP